MKWKFSNACCDTIAIHLTQCDAIIDWRAKSFFHLVCLRQRVFNFFLLAVSLSIVYFKVKALFWFHFIAADNEFQDNSLILCDLPLMVGKRSLLLLQPAPFCWGACRGNPKNLLRAFNFSNSMFGWAKGPSFLWWNISQIWLFMG